LRAIKPIYEDLNKLKLYGPGIDDSV